MIPARRAFVSMLIMLVGGLVLGGGSVAAALPRQTGVPFTCNVTTGIYTNGHAITVQPYDPACTRPDGTPVTP